MAIDGCRVAVVCDHPEEGWPSMDLTGAMVERFLAERHADTVTPTRICPPYRRRFERPGKEGAGAEGAARNADRLMNRFWDYPRALGRIAKRGEFDLYHLVDHSYSQLVHVLPRGRAVVTCHDLDTFRCLFEPALEPRPVWFRAMAGRILAGLRKAAAVSCDSAATRDALVARGIAPAERAHVVYLGVHPECSPAPDPEADAAAERLLGPAGSTGPDLLHVGSNIARKRVDVLLDVFAAVRKQHPGARLLKAGGALPPPLAARARRLGVADAIVTLPHFSPLIARNRAALAAVYRRAALVLQPSDAEGFGLPVAEALACGVPLLASDIPVLREVGGDAPVYRPVGDVPGWTEAALSLLEERRRSSDSWLARRASGLARAQLYSWAAHADRLAEIYREVLSRSRVSRPSVH
jgi:glycosyltransferase involved in cell wall biosynthesis